MEITWLGHSCFRIKGAKTTIITDPNAPEGSTPPPKLSADIVTLSRPDAAPSIFAAVTGNPRLIKGPGEYEIGGVLILGIPTPDGVTNGLAPVKNTLYLLEMDEIAILHCGSLRQMPSAAVIEEIGNVDVLMVPVGNKTTIGATAAAELVRRLEPKVVLPMQYPAGGFDADREPVDKFLKEVGSKEITPQPKLTITKPRLPLTTQVVLLQV
jgi:L-ascorbate metabolism protein UlaG (beta-lactamase superfamily)